MRAAFNKVWGMLKAHYRGRGLSRQVEDILSRVDAMPTIDSRSPEQILVYDENGLPR